MSEPLEGPCYFCVGRKQEPKDCALCRGTGKERRHTHRRGPPGRRECGEDCNSCDLRGDIATVLDEQIKDYACKFCEKPITQRDHILKSIFCKELSGPNGVHHGMLFAHAACVNPPAPEVAT